MNAKRFADELEKLNQQQDRIMASYVRKGYVTTPDEEKALHMSFSPYRVPRGLTKRQVRLRIARYNKGKNKLKPNPALENRLEIYINGGYILGASFTGEVPNTHRKLRSLLKKL